MSLHIKILILNWNKKELLRSCIESVLKIDYSNFSVMVIDNCSTDGSQEMIKKNYPSVECMLLDKNYGFSNGYNNCFENLNNKDTDFVLLLNNDTEVDVNILKAFNDARLTYGNNQIYGGKIFYQNDRNKIWYAGGNYNLKWFYIAHRGIRKKDSQEFSFVDETMYITGCCLFTSMKVIQRLNGFDTNFKMYGEDVDFCIRAKEINIKCYYCPDAKLWHHISASLGGKYTFKKLRRKFIGIKRLVFKHYWT